jgi:hypothetical protein
MISSSLQHATARTIDSDRAHAASKRRRRRFF